MVYYWPLADSNINYNRDDLEGIGIKKGYVYAPEVLWSVRKGHVIDQGPMAIEWSGHYDNHI